MIELLVVGLASAILGGAAIFGLVYLVGRITYWKSMYEANVRDLDSALDKIAESNKIAQAVAEKYDTMMSLVKSMMARPVAAAITDDQIAQIATVMSQLVMQHTSPSRIN